MRRASGALASAVAIIALTGCYIHKGPTKVLKPEGETVTIETAGDPKVTGELLGLASERLILLRGERLLALPLGSFSSVKVEGYPTLTASDREKLHLYARYPQGLSDDQWRQLLLERGQHEFDLLMAH
jgi:hypothetical protein